MTNKQGDFIWYELMTSDADAAQDFYGGLIGWQFQHSGQEGTDYRQFLIGETMIGGLMPLSDEMIEGGARPLWTGYIGVEDVDARAAAVTTHGGEVLLPPQDIPGVGRFAYVKDPQGAPFYIMQPISTGEVSESFSKYEPKVGHCAWNELSTDDPQSVVRFYAHLFDWSVAESMDMGPIGQYDMLKNGAERDFMFGAVMQKPDEIPVSLWSFYFRVSKISEAVDYINANGGQTLSDPIEIPGGDFTLMAMDPQGAAFALIGAQ